MATTVPSPRNEIQIEQTECFIGGQWVPAASGKTFATIDPATEQEIEDTKAVMGGEDWELWIDALDRAGVLAQGARSVKLEVRESNEPARGLYEKFGFEYLRTLPKYYADGEDAYVLVASLEDRDGF